MPCALDDGFSSSPYNAYGQAIDASSDTSSGTADLHVPEQQPARKALATPGYADSWQSQWNAQHIPSPPQAPTQAPAPAPAPVQMQAPPTAQNQYESLFTIQPRTQPQIGGASTCGVSVLHVATCPTCRAAITALLQPRFSLSAWAQENQVLFIGIVALLLFLLDKFIMLRYRA